MKKLHSIRKINSHYRFDKKACILPVICLIIGAILGTASALVLSTETAQPVNEYLNNFFSAYSLQGVDRAEVFRISVHNNIKMLIVLWISGLSVFLIPFLAIYVGAKGFKLGFAISFLIKNYSYSGAVLSLTSMLSQMVIVIPLLILYSGYSIKLAPKIRQLREKKMSNDEKKHLFITNLSAIFVSIFVLVLASCIDTYIVPLISAPICRVIG